MSTLVIVGLIGSGKTTLAQSIKGHRYISFDEWWHVEIQHARGEPLDTARNVAAIINATTGPCVIDGWWTWDARWWETEEDETLGALEHASRPIRLLHLTTTRDEALAAYREKWLTGQYKGTPLDDREAYAASIPARQAYLSRKVAEWAR